MVATIRLGVYDWTQFCPEQGFYPDDLPQEWRLDYFSNEFEAACICVSSLKDDSDLLSEWLDDIRNEFSLGFYVDNYHEWELLRGLIEQSDVAIDSILIPQQHSELLEPIKTLELKGVFIESMWSLQRSTQKSNVALIPKQKNLRAYRACIESWVHNQVDTDSEFTLWLQACNLSYQELEDVKTLIELMGY